MPLLSNSGCLCERVAGACLVTQSRHLLLHILRSCNLLCDAVDIQECTGQLPEVNLTQDAYHYEIRHTGRLRRLELSSTAAPGLVPSLDSLVDRVDQAEQHITWGPDDDQVDWVSVTAPDPRRFDVLQVHVSHNEAWRAVLLRMDRHHYAHCSKKTDNVNENRSYCLGYDSRTGLLGPGRPGGPAAGRVVCILRLYKRCEQGGWHLPAQFKLRNERRRPPQCDAECLQTLFGARSRHLKCRVSAELCCSLTVLGNAHVLPCLW